MEAYTGTMIREALPPLKYRLHVHLRQAVDYLLIVG